MAENIVVGAGLAGMVAAINLARQGREVLVIEGESRVGGSAAYHPSPQGTPVDPSSLEEFTGIDIRPALHKFKGRANVYGEMIDTEPEAISASLVERGPRSTSLDNYLYEIAAGEGVQFEFSHPVISNDDFAGLPPDTIVATGLYFEGFDALRVPYLTSFHYVSRQTVPESSENHVTIYQGRFTSDYAYTCSVNGIQFAHVFQRGPIGRDTLRAFEEQVYSWEGLQFSDWDHFTFPVPAAWVNNPRLFAGDKILAGTLAGCMEPYMFFGILGALVSGKIAAVAVTDKAKAFEQFRLATSSFRGAYMVRKVVNLMPHPIRGLILRYGLKRVFAYPAAAEVVKRSMPGYKTCERAQLER